VAQTLIAEWENAVERVQDQPILDAAIALAKKGDLNSAIQTAEKIESDRALYSEAQSNIGQWVAQIQAVEDRPILNEAEALASDGRLSEAISRASDIGPSRAMYDEAQSRIADWAERRRQIEAANQPPPPQEEYQEPSSQDETVYEEPAPPVEETAPPPEESAPPATSDGGGEPPADDGGAASDGGGETGSNPNF
jgi:soluble cytochrome b562